MFLLDLYMWIIGDVQSPYIFGALYLMEDNFLYINWRRAHHIRLYIYMYSICWQGKHYGGYPIIQIIPHLSN